MSTPPVPPQTDKTALYIALGIGGGFLFLCVAPALIVVCLAAIQILGTNASTTFQTVGQSLGTTVDAPTQTTAGEAALAFVRALERADYEQAHALLIPDLRQRITAQFVREKWDDNPVLNARNKLTFQLNALGTGTAVRQRFRVDWTDREQQTVVMDVVVSRAKNGIWEVSLFGIR